MKFSVEEQIVSPVWRLNFVLLLMWWVLSLQVAMNPETDWMLLFGLHLVE
jgi:hypothetical protein